MIVDPKARENCSVIVRKLEDIYNRCMEEKESYCLSGSPEPMSEEMSPIENCLAWGGEKARSGVDNTWMANSGPSCEGHGRIGQIHAGANNTWTDQLAREAALPSSTPHRNAAVEADEQTPLLAPLTESTISEATSQRVEDDRGNEAPASEHSSLPSHNQVKSSTPNGDRSCCRGVVSGWLDFLFGCWPG